MRADFEYYNEYNPEGFARLVRIIFWGLMLTIIILT